ncbi:hypothetical protein GWK48_10175 [Metallosphaera tengchongensis]|uniref:Uncharacterized protein n=1 Tax=Metallosphaera tengchongensis TaxID=1532350 RepID=A0A6N0NV69_9CREN|nr:hypothetical protein [Metallosphaera tengchongensis]QKR00706.1 hypothetical protein GWK48_10175 [Metallosphaera tengchongensis]
MVSLFQALLAVGFERVAPRTLQRGGTKVEVKFGSEVKWIVSTPFGTASYLSQRAALHGMVLRLALTQEDLSIIRDLGVEYAEEELRNFERTMKRVEAARTKAIQRYINAHNEVRRSKARTRHGYPDQD